MRNPAGRIAFPTTLLVTMMASSYQIFAIAVLASRLIDEFGLSRAEVGLIGAVNTLVGAATAPFSGRLTDRIGARRSLIAVLVVGALAMAVMAAAPNTWVLGLSTAIGGISQGWGNPATNAVISTRVPAGRRGAVTGVKQSGVTLGVFLSGASLPVMADAWGWRAAIWVFAGAFALVALVAQLTLGADPTGREPAVAGRPGRAPHHRLDPFIVRLAVYALLMGTAGGAVGRFFPLYAEEAIGLSNADAGLIVAAGGLLGMVARVLVGRAAEHRVDPTRLLGILALVGAAYALVLVVATPSTRALLYLSPPLNAVGIAAWNAVAMLAIIVLVATTDAGRASGLVMLGFLGGLTISAPLAGLAVDQWGTYRPVWAATAALAVGAALLMLTSPVRRRRGASGTMVAAR